MCYCFAESMDHLFIHCPVAYSLWVQMLQVFGIQWIMPGSVESLVSCCCCNWLGKFSLDIWNMVPSCLMWVVWLERNDPLLRFWRECLISYKLSTKILFLNELGVGFLQAVLLLWSFFLPLEVPLKLLFFFFILLLSFAVFCVHHHEHLVFSVFVFFHD